MNRRAVSLTETVVSVGTVTALLCTLLPALGEARRGSKEVHCISNMSRIADAGAIHAATNTNEFAIPRHPLMGLGVRTLGEVEWGGKAGIGGPLSGNDPFSSKWGTQEGRGPGSRKLNNIIYKNGFNDYRDIPGGNNGNWASDTRLELGVFHCPGDYGYTGSHFTEWRDSKLTSFDHYGNSYAASTFWVGIAGPSCTLLSNSPFLRPVTQVPSPARTLLYTENCALFAWRQNYGADGCGSPFGDGGIGADTVVSGWHGVPFTFNVSFVDGHVARTRIDGHIQPQPRIGRYPYEGHDFWRCVIVRGVDWQKDTLPAAPVPTIVSCDQGPSIVPPVGQLKAAAYSDSLTGRRMR